MGHLVRQQPLLHPPTSRGMRWFESSRSQSCLPFSLCGPAHGPRPITRRRTSTRPACGQRPRRLSPTAQATQFRPLICSAPFWSTIASRNQPERRAPTFVAITAPNPELLEEICAETPAADRRLKGVFRGPITLDMPIRLPQPQDGRRAAARPAPRAGARSRRARPPASAGRSDR